ncbi:hypothetical protein OUZ56_020510 [Daphnia magna]|nr:hypothetical protein OUZ56_020510 [Daphnia magna]
MYLSSAARLYDVCSCHHMYLPKSLHALVLNFLNSRWPIDWMRWHKEISSSYASSLMVVVLQLNFCYRKVSFIMASWIDYPVDGLL